MRFKFSFILILLLVNLSWGQDMAPYARKIFASFNRMDYKSTIQNCNEAIRIDPNPKQISSELFYTPYFFKGVSLFYEDNFDSAFATLTRSREKELGILPTYFRKQHNCILESLTKIRKLQDEKRQTEKKVKQLSDEESKLTEAINITEQQRIVQRKFDAALQYYFSRDYDKALALLDDILRDQYDHQFAANLKSKINYEKALMPPKLDTVITTITQRDTLTSDPILAISPIDSVTKQEALTLVGEASDDMGIDYVRFIINGESYYQEHEGNLKNLLFERNIPLLVGTNHIEVIAYDREIPVKSTKKEYKIEREIYIPWYQRSAVVVPLVLIFLFPAVLFLFIWIKKVTVRIEDIPNPYIVGPPIEDKDKFYGREEFLKKIEDALYRSSVVIQGERRIGKTSVLRQLKYRLNRPMYPILMSMEQVVSESTFLQDLALGIFRGSSEYLFDIAEAQMNRIKERGRDYGSYDLFDDLTWIIGKFKELDPQAKLIILLDEVDRTNNWDPSLQQNLRGIFLQSTTDVRLVLAGVWIVDRILDDKTSPWYNPCRHFVLEPLTENECRELITGPAKGFNYHVDAIEHIMSMNQCKPHFIQMTCSYAFETAQHHRTKDITYEMAQKAFDQAVDEYSTDMETVWATLPLALRRTFQLGTSIDGFKYTSEINRLVEMNMCSRNPLKRKVVPSPIFKRWIERSKNA